MVTQEQAERIAERVAGAPADDAENGWTLEEFDAGWLIHEKASFDLMGAASRVVERASGRVMSFPSHVSPQRIVTKYDQVTGDGFQEDVS